MGLEILAALTVLVQPTAAIVLTSPSAFQNVSQTLFTPDAWPVALAYGRRWAASLGTGDRR